MPGARRTSTRRAVMPAPARVLSSCPRDCSLSDSSSSRERSCSEASGAPGATTSASASGSLSLKNGSRATTESCGAFSAGHHSISGLSASSGKGRTATEASPRVTAARARAGVG